MFEYNMLPCHKENENYMYYKGNTNIHQNNKRCRKCEFVKSLCLFLLKEYRNYAIERCCDVDFPSTNQPEAILVNKRNPLDKMVIEVKSIYELFDKNINTDIEERKKTYHFQNALDKIGTKVFEILNSRLEKINLVLTPELEELFLYGLLLNIYVDSEYKEINGYKYNQSQSTYKEFLGYKNKNEMNLINKISENVVDYIMSNIKSCIKSYKFIPYYKFKIDKFNFTIGKTDKDSMFSIQWFGGQVGSSIFNPPNGAIESQMKKFFSECKVKFSNYMSKEYKRILLIINENQYSKDRLIKIMEEVEKPSFIHEIWGAFYVCDEIWNEKLGDFDGEEIVDIDYVKIYEY